MEHNNQKTYAEPSCEKEQSPIDRALSALSLQAEYVEKRALHLRERLATVTTQAPRLASASQIGPVKVQCSMCHEIDRIKATLDEAETIINITINELEL